MRLSKRIRPTLALGRLLVASVALPAFPGTQAKDEC
jgi:hypothetical protein